ncbi:MAG TPA: multifunctional CCA tRNA nucleotidyl transferase/2'3'-cyclic phosphodiesterase/2'nucleotidase/phosphatase [Gammaproteobacteria bacterium]
MEIFLVGGAVRDRLLGIEPGERDWVVLGSTAEEMLALGFRRLDAEFPVFAHPESGEEYALARREEKAGAGHKGFTVEFDAGVTLEEDLRRRDLRVNAIAESSTGDLIDPFGGRADLESRVLRHVSPAFVEDPLRVLRAARFAARLAGLGFEISPATRELMKAMSESDDMRFLSGGRIWREMDRALATDHPARFFLELMACGALPILFPEFAIEHESRESLATLDTVGQRDPRPELRFAALINICSGTDSLATAQILERLDLRFPLPKKYAELARIVSITCPAAASDASEMYSALEAVDAFRRPERFADALIVCEVLGAGGAADKPMARLQKAFQVAAAVSGADVARHGAGGAETGIELKRLRIRAMEKTLTS